jgi:hypothetical protein
LLIIFNSETACFNVKLFKNNSLCGKAFYIRYTAVKTGHRQTGDSRTGDRKTVGRKTGDRETGEKKTKFAKKTIFCTKTSIKFIESLSLKSLDPQYQ